ncbi:MAG: cellulase-like family protein [Aquabacterium sp.]|nr:cellulase-like family protein [Aquabacterium sp.]
MQHFPPTASDSVPESNPRRHALKQIATAGLGAVALSTPGLSHAAIAAPPMLTVRRAPLAVAMWDFSWLTRRAGTQAEYSDFDAVLDDFVLRGYNCLRIDAFPHLIAADGNGRRQDEFVMKAQPSGFPWGNSANTTINPRRDLPVFLSKCAARGIRVGLSTWMTNDTSNRALSIKSPAQLSRIWAETLDFIGQHGLLGIVEWVDLANEFPSVGFMPAIVSYINEKLLNKITLLTGLLAPYDQEQGSAISAYIYTAINGLKKQFPHLPLCVSLAGESTNTFKSVDLSPMDCIETHIFLGLNQTFALPSGLNFLLIEGAGNLQSSCYNNTLEKWAQGAYYRRQAGLLRWLGGAMDSWVTLGNKLNVPVYTTEGWAAILYYELPDKDPNGANWVWINDVARAATGMAKARGWTGICTSNFCQPHFPSFYKNPAWHQQITGLIKTAS